MPPRISWYGSLCHAKSTLKRRTDERDAAREQASRLRLALAAMLVLEPGREPRYRTANGIGQKIPPKILLIVKRAIREQTDGPSHSGQRQAR